MTPRRCLICYTHLHHPFDGEDFCAEHEQLPVFEKARHVRFDRLFDKPTL